MSVITIGTRLIAADEPTFLIAEAGSNHDGKLEQALEMIQIAADTGADAIKFQLFRASNLYPSNCGVVDTPDGPHDFFELMRGLEMPYEWLPDLFDEAARCRIELLFSTFDQVGADLCVKFGSPAIKIASPEITHLPLLAYLRGLGVPVILSTGMARLGEIEEAIDILNSQGPMHVALLHCVTSYPCPPEDANLDAIGVLSAAFGTQVGWSDHTLDPIAAPLVAVALGASIVEKHFTLSRNLAGPDHRFAIEPNEMAELRERLDSLHRIDSSKRVAVLENDLGKQIISTLRGESRKFVAPSEMALSIYDRRSLHATENIAAGTKVTESNVSVLRGERNLVPGLHPRYWPIVDGAEVIRDVQYGNGIVWEDFLRRT